MPLQNAFASVHRGLYGLVIVAMLGATPVAAQQSPSVADTADRPGFADSPVLLGRGHVQIEFGFTSEREDDGQQSLHSFTWPQVELHAGVGSRLELSVYWDGLISSTLTSDSGSEQDTAGGADVRVGGKVRLLHHTRFEMALIGYATVPVRSASLSSRYADPFGRLAWAASIPTTGSSALNSFVVFVKLPRRSTSRP